MSIYFKNTNEPKKGFNNYVWSWLNSNLANFGKELSSYITGTTTNIKDEGSPIVSTHDINFVGAGVTVTENPLGVAEINIPGGGGLEGTNYLYVMADGTDTENATELQAAYTTAQGMSPSATNRITIVCGPGYYNFGSSTFTMSTQYIDLVSLDGNRSVIFNSANAAGTISITANDVFVKGIDVGTKNFTIADNLNLLKVENCKGGDYSFGGDPSFSNPITVSGTFINCQGGNYSFGGYGTASGTFTNCQGGTGPFGFAQTASGTFTNCQGGIYSFGGMFSLGGGTASGTFTNCQGGNSSFGLYGTLSGKLYYCRLTSGTFETVSGGGITRLCLDGSNVENNQG